MCVCVWACANARMNASISARLCQTLITHTSRIIIPRSLLKLTFQCCQGVDLVSWGIQCQVASYFLPTLGERRTRRVVAMAVAVIIGRSGIFVIFYGVLIKTR